MREFALRPGRAEIEMPVDLRTGGDSFACTSKNLGIGGLCVATDRSFQVGERLAVRFTLPDRDHSISASVEVRWIGEAQGRAPGIGLRFVNLPVAAVVAIQTFLGNLDGELSPLGRST